MAKLRISSGVTLDYTDEGWSEYKKWLDGTYARLKYAWTDEGAAYSIVAFDDKLYRIFSINKADASEFEATYKVYSPTQPDLGVTMKRKDGTYVSVEPDGRMVVVNFPADEGTYMWLTGAGDDIENGVRGGGTEIVVEFDDTTRTEPEVKTLDVSFMEWIQLHDGQVTVTDNAQWGLGDKWDWGVLMPATTVVPNATNEGNCNVVNPQGQPGQPDSYIIVPAAGDGAFDVDLDDAVPVPASGQGFWEFDWRTDVVAPSANPGGAGWYLLAVDAPMAYFMRRVNVPIHHAGNFDFDAYKAERIYRRWKLRLVVSKKSSGPGKLSGWIVCFREYNT
jgi:hypothetical protein